MISPVLRNSLLVVLLMTMAATARPLSPQERASLEATAQFYFRAFWSRDYEAMARTLPPRIIKRIADQSPELDQVTLYRLIASQISDALTSANIKTFAFDMEAIRVAELKDGQPYALIPSVMTIDGGSAGKYRMKFETLALFDTDRWYLASVSDVSQLHSLQLAYPEFANVEFSNGSTEALKD